MIRKRIEPSEAMLISILQTVPIEERQKILNRNLPISKNAMDIVRKIEGINDAKNSDSR
jgi:hypothetical protein